MCWNREEKYQAGLIKKIINYFFKDAPVNFILPCTDTGLPIHFHPHRLPA